MNSHSNSFKEFEYISQTDSSFVDRLTAAGVDRQEAKSASSSFIILDKKPYKQGRSLGCGIGGQIYELEQFKSVSYEEKNTYVLKDFSYFYYKESRMEYTLMELLYGGAAISYLESDDLDPSKWRGMVVRHKIEGVDLGDLFHVTPKEFLEITINVLLTYQVLHELKIWHRDIKMTNVLIDEEGYIYPIDFDQAIYPASPSQLETDFLQLYDMLEIMICRYISCRWSDSSRPITVSYTQVGGKEHIPAAAKSVLDFDYQIYQDLCTDMRKTKDFTKTIGLFSDFYFNTYQKKFSARYPRFACNSRKDKQSQCIESIKNKISDSRIRQVNKRKRRLTLNLKEAIVSLLNDFIFLDNTKETIQDEKKVERINLALQAKKKIEILNQIYEDININKDNYFMPPCCFWYRSKAEHNNIQILKTIFLEELKNYIDHSSIKKDDFLNQCKDNPLLKHQRSYFKCLEKTTTWSQDKALELINRKIHP